YLSHADVRSAEDVLGHYHLAASLAQPSMIADPTGHLTRLQTQVAQGYAQRRWVKQRCRQAYTRVEERIQAVRMPAPLHDQAMAWLFAAGGMPHVLLVAGLENPTVRRRYVAVRALLAKYAALDYQTALLDLLGVGQ